MLHLSLRGAMDLGLAHNLGLLLSREGVASARGQRLIELSKLLPNISTGAGVHRAQESLAITGITLPGAPSVVGPFTFYDARVFLTQRLLDLEALKRVRAAQHDVAAAELSANDARELVVVAVGATYLEALAATARVDTVQAQVETARTVLDRAVQLHQAGVSPGIDELRARVEFLSRSQQLIAAENELAKVRLQLVRLIGVPVGQEIDLTDNAPYGKFSASSPEDLILAALAFREDYRAAQELVKAAEASSQAARAQRLPTLVLDADYGVTGLQLSSLRDTYHIVGSLRFPVFEGGKIHGNILRADALERQRREERADLAERIAFQVRTALLDVEAAAKQVEVAGKTVELAELTLSQARERFSSGISDNLEVVQAQQSVAAGHEALISSLYQYNLARLLLARAMGTAEKGTTGIDGK